MVSESPIDQVLSAIDALDVDAVVALCAPDVQVLTVDGRRASGMAATRELIASFLGQLHSASHRVTAQWHEDDVWIAEVEASYELADSMQLSALPRAFVVRAGPEGIGVLHAYGAHEQPLAEHRAGSEGLWAGGRWIPPL
jgi:hypothetical protein